jgi:hypothetical protein
MGEDREWLLVKIHWIRLPGTAARRYDGIGNVAG